MLSDKFMHITKFTKLLDFRLFQKILQQASCVCALAISSVRNGCVINISSLLMRIRLICNLIIVCETANQLIWHLSDEWTLSIS